MAKYIDMDKLLEDIEHSVVFAVHPDKPSAELRGANKIIDRIRCASTADVVEVRHGEWVLAAYDTAVPYALGKWNIWICSECGYRRKAGWEHTEDGRKPRAKYCENCMAKMDGGADDATD